MSRAFVKDSDGSEADELPDRIISAHRNLVTAEGAAQIEAQCRTLRDQLSAARAADDRATVAHCARDLRYWTQRRSSAELVPAPVNEEVARFGSHVVLLRDDGTSLRLRIVGQDEADPAQGLISYVSPLANAVLGVRVGDTVEVAGRPARVVQLGIRSA